MAQSAEYSVIDLQQTAGSSSMVRGINNSGIVVGWSGKPFNTETRGFVWTSGAQLQALPSLAGSDFSEALGINELGDIVGSSNTKEHLQALIWTRNEELRDLGTLPGDSGAQARSINKAGDVVGSSFGPNGTSAFLWTRRDGMQRLPLLAGADFSEAKSINNAGLVAGTSGPIHGNHLAVLWQNAASVRSLGILPGDKGSEAYAINNLGHVVGASTGPAGVRAWIWSAKSGMQSLGWLPGGDFSMALAINNRGEVVGKATTAEGASHAFIWTSRDGMRDLNNLIPDAAHLLLVAGLGINDRGQIVVYGGDRDTYDHDTPISVYLLTPK